MGSQKVTLTLPADLLARIDEAAKTSYTSRSDYLREAALLRLNKQQLVQAPREIKQSEAAFLQELDDRYAEKQRENC